MTDDEIKVLLAKFWVNQAFDGAEKAGCDMTIVAEESLVRSMAILTGHQPEVVRAKLLSVFRDEVEKARALLEAQPAGEG